MISHVLPFSISWLSDNLFSEYLQTWRKDGDFFPNVCPKRKHKKTVHLIVNFFGDFWSVEVPVKRGEHSKEKRKKKNISNSLGVSFNVFLFSEWLFARIRMSHIKCIRLCSVRSSYLLFEKAFQAFKSPYICADGRPFLFLPVNHYYIYKTKLWLLACCRCGVELNNTKCTFSPCNAFDTSILLGIWTFILNARR